MTNPITPPTVMEIIELHSWLEDEWRANNDGEDLPMLDYARAVLAKWGTPAIQPVPVAHQDKLDTACKGARMSMIGPDYRALCANLLWAIQIYTGQNPSASEMSSTEITKKLMDAMAAAAAALAQSKPSLLSGATNEL